MVIGERAIWADRFRSLDKRVLARVLAVWDRCLVGLPSQPYEDTITIQLVDVLSQDPEIRRLVHWIEFQYEPFGYQSDGTAYSKGKIDMAVLLDQDRERYLAYECKRLNLIHRGRRSSLATLYVTKGLQRFITEQYAEKLPVGCMLGYVLDGDLPFAHSKVLGAIETRRCGIGLSMAPIEDTVTPSLVRFSSRHRRTSSGDEIEIRHTLLACRSRTR